MLILILRPESYLDTYVLLQIYDNMKLEQERGITTGDGPFKKDSNYLSLTIISLIITDSSGALDVELTLTLAILSTTSIPSITCPKTVWT